MSISIYKSKSLIYKNTQCTESGFFGDKYAKVKLYFIAHIKRNKLHYHANLLFIVPSREGRIPPPHVVLGINSLNGTL